jgi:hypothetical protein
MTIQLRLSLQKGTAPTTPQFHVPGHTRGKEADRGYHATTGVGPDLMTAAKDAVRSMIDLMGNEYDIDPPMACALCSVAVDLKISEIVDVPNWCRVRVSSAGDLRLSPPLPTLRARGSRLDERARTRALILLPSGLWTLDFFQCQGHYRACPPLSIDHVIMSPGATI